MSKSFRIVWSAARNASIVLREAEPDCVIVAREGSSPLLGLSDEGNYAASDASALLQVTRRMVYLENGDCAELKRDGYRITRVDGTPVERAEKESTLSTDAVELGAYRHYMQKEIFEQPVALAKVLELEPQIKAWAERFAMKQHALFLGRGRHYPIAMEGALKLKEISYIHAEAYAAGELKHGPLALVDKEMPVIAVEPNDALIEKLRSNLQEVRARGGELYVFADADCEMEESEGVHVLQLPEHYGVLGTGCPTYVAGLPCRAGARYGCR